METAQKGAQNVRFYFTDFNGYDGLAFAVSFP